MPFSFKLFDLIIFVHFLIEKKKKECKYFDFYIRNICKIFNCFGNNLREFPRYLAPASSILLSLY